MNVKQQKLLGRDHYYVTQALITEANKNDVSTGDLFSMGEDEFIAEVFGYSVVLSQLFNKNDIEPSEKYFNIIERIAAHFWKVTMNLDSGDMNCPLMSVDHFRIMVKSAITR